MTKAAATQKTAARPQRFLFDAELSFSAYNPMLVPGTKSNFPSLLTRERRFWHDSGLSGPFHQQLRPQTAFRGTNRNFPNLARCFQTRKVRFRAILGEMAVTTFGKSEIVPSRSSLRRKTRRACPPCQARSTRAAQPALALSAACGPCAKYARTIHAACGPHARCWRIRRRRSTA